MERSLSAAAACRGRARVWCVRTKTGSLDFGEFFQSVVTYCLFEKKEVLKFCFYIFDRDKNGYIERDELQIMINVLYHVSPPEEVKGNTKIALTKLDVNDDGKVRAVLAESPLTHP